MGVKLVYHKNSSSRSPFDEVIRNIVDEEDVKIASPYIWLEYLKGVTEKSCGWRLLTDWEALLMSVSKKEREEIIKFAEKNKEKIHNVQGLHAKVILSCKKAIIGSANFTRNGMEKKDEMSVYLDDNKSLRELNEWFDKLWDKGREVEIDELKDYLGIINGIPVKTNDRNTSFYPNSLATKAPVFLPRIQPTSTQIKLAEDPELSKRFIRFFRRAGSLSWVEGVFELAGKLIEHIGLTTEDSRLVVSLTKSKPYLSVIINQRCVFAALWKNPQALFFMVPQSYRIPDYLRSEITRGDNFSPKGNETKKNAPSWLELKVSQPSDVPNELIEQWLKVAVKQPPLGKRSSYRKNHHRLIYDMATDEKERKRILDELSVFMSK